MTRAYPARLEGPHVRDGRGPLVDADTQLYKRLLSRDNKDRELVEGGLWVRLLGVQTPEVNRLATREMGLRFSRFASDWLAAREGLWPLEMGVEEVDNFGRLLAWITDPTGESLAGAFVAEGDRIGVDVRYPGGAAAQVREARGE